MQNTYENSEREKSLIFRVLEARTDTLGRFADDVKEEWTNGDPIFKRLDALEGLKVKGNDDDFIEEAHLMFKGFRRKGERHKLAEFKWFFTLYYGKENFKI